MEKRRASFTPTFFFFLSVLSVFPEVYCGEERITEVYPNTMMMFVFGDSYADTGNTPNGSASWMEPYGVTFPGKPSGRFSDGRVLTDFIANYLGIESPAPYRRRGWIGDGGKKVKKDGVNFAYGGTGVFTTLLGGPNMSTQLDEFQQLVKQNVYTKHDLSSSLAHVSVAGNDYTTFELSDDPQKDITVFAESVINQLVVNLKRLYELGVGRVSVINAPPFGCLPKNATSSTLCNETINSSSELHNQLLKSAVEKLNSETGGSTFLILDLYSAFISALQGKKSSFENGLNECCRGTTSGSSCGDVDKDYGTKKYVVCEDPKRSFFWDTVHPSQQGWLSVFSNLAPSLHTFLFPSASVSSLSAVI